MANRGCTKYVTVKRYHLHLCEMGCKLSHTVAHRDMKILLSGAAMDAIKWIWCLEFSLQQRLTHVRPLTEDYIVYLLPHTDIPISQCGAIAHMICSSNELIKAALRLQLLSVLECATCMRMAVRADLQS